MMFIHKFHAGRVMDRERHTLLKNVPFVFVPLCQYYIDCPLLVMVLGLDKPIVS